MSNINSTIEDQILSALNHISCEDRDLWLRMGMALKNELGEVGFDIWNNWSRTATNYNEKDARTTWKSIKPDGGTRIGTLFYEAKHHGYAPRRLKEISMPQNKQGSEIDNKQIDSVLDEGQVVNRAQKIFNAALPESEHPYLASKGVQGYGLRIINHHECRQAFWARNKNGDSKPLTGNLLLIPLYNTDRALCGLQAIDEAGHKSLLKGMFKSGLFHPVFNGRKIDSDYDEELYIAEGFATAATIHELIDVPTVMAIDAGNLKHVALGWRQYCPKAHIVIAGDYDQNGVGQKAAFEAARAVGGQVVLPTFTTDSKLENGKSPSDFNDLYLIEGKEKVQKNLVEFQDVPANLSTISSRKNHSHGVELICGADLKPEPIRWLWYGWLAAGKLHILAGAPGTGKTTIALSLAAIMTNSSMWPDESRAICTRGNVLIWSGEDDPKDVLLPRFIAQGGDPKRIFFVGNVVEGSASRSFQPSRDMEQLFKKALEIGDIRLIIVDSVVSVIQGDTHKNGDVRRDLKPLVDLAEKLGAVVLGITHFSKGTVGRDPLERVTGSLAFVALARIVLVTSSDAQNQAKRLLVRAKSNIGPSGGGFDYSLNQIELSAYKGIFASQIMWGDSIDGSARELLDETTHQDSEHNSSALEEAKDFLRSLLMSGSISVKAIESEAKSACISKSTLRRAKEALKIKSERDGYGQGAIYTWSLPTCLSKNLIDAQQ